MLVYVDVAVHKNKPANFVDEFFVFLLHVYSEINLQ